MANRPNRAFSAYGTILAGLAIAGVSIAALDRSPSSPAPTNAPTPSPLAAKFSAPPARATEPETSVRATPKAVAEGNVNDLTELRNLDKSFADLAEYVAPSVVHIRSTGVQRVQGATGPGLQTGGEGSGFIYRSDGVIVTNDHVVGGYNDVEVELKDGRTFRGKVTRAEDSDVAIVKIEAKDLPVLKVADSATVRPGEFAVAIGAPLGLENSVTIGHVSALGRTNSMPTDGGTIRLYPDLIQTDAAINPGNSGGPLINVNGEVIGMNTMIFSLNGGGSSGIGFAIPASQFGLVADTLLRDGKLTRSRLGLIPENVKEYRQKELGISGGAQVTRIEEGPAQRAGVQKDDVILRIGQTPVRGQIDVRNAMLRYAPGTTVDIEVLRGKDRKTLPVRLEKAEPVKVEAPTIRQRAPQGLDEQGFEELRRQMEERMRGGSGQGGNPFGNGSGSRDEEDVPPVRQGKAELGVSLKDAPGVKGATVDSVAPGSVAERLGMRSGDVVEAFDGKAVASGADLVRAMAGVTWGETHRVRFHRGTADAKTTIERSVKFQ